MRYTLRCLACSEHVTIRGFGEDDTNALVLDDNDPNWRDACDHLVTGYDYEVISAEYADDGE